MVLVVFLLFAGLCLGLVFELSQLFQLHEFGRSAPNFVYARGWLNAKIVRKGTRTEGRQHVVHDNVRAEVSNAHCHLIEPVNELPQ